jgi:hypothetical protein
LHTYKSLMPLLINKQKIYELQWYCCNSINEFRDAQFYLLNGQIYS